MTYPAKFISGKINDNSGNNQDYAGDYQDFTKIRHKQVSKLQIFEILKYNNKKIPE